MFFRIYSFSSRLRLSSSGIADGGAHATQTMGKVAVAYSSVYTPSSRDLMERLGGICENTVRKYGSSSARGPSSLCVVWRSGRNIPVWAYLLHWFIVGVNREKRWIFYRLGAFLHWSV